MRRIVDLGDGLTVEKTPEGGASLRRSSGRCNVWVQVDRILELVEGANG